MRSFLLFAGLTSFAATANADARWHWETRFSDAEKAGLTAWIEHTLGGMDALFGNTPGTFDVHFHRSQDTSEAVPWGETNKGGGRHAHFFVDTDYPWSDFEEDWTAPHELSHLLFPYLGEDSRWFSEGVASYLQFQIMYADGVLTWKQAIARYAERLGAAEAAAKGPISIVARSRDGASGGYIPIYWGGAAYFLYADRLLQQRRGMRLAEVIRKYSDCCFQPWGTDAAGMIREFDRLSASTVFSDAYDATVSRPGFPQTAETLRWLAEHPPVLVDTTHHASAP
jgi:hypothetical protein